MLVLLVASQLFFTPTAQAADPAWALVPGGAGVYVHGHPWRGTAYALTQAAGGGILAWGTVAGASAEEAGDDAAYARASTLTAVGVTLLAASYVAGAFDASHLHDVEIGDGGAEPPRNAPPPAVTAPVEPPAPTASAGPAPEPAPPAAPLPDTAPASPAPPPTDAAPAAEPHP